MEMLWSIFYVAFLGIVSHFYGQALPRAHFKEDKFPYRPCVWEKGGGIYRKLGVHKWREHLPDMSRYLSDMIPKRFHAHMTPREIEALIKETCVAEHVHIVLCVAFLAVCRFWQDNTWLLLWVIYSLCNIPYILIQRYNRPILMRMLKRSEARLAFFELSKATEVSGSCDETKAN